MDISQETAQQTEARLRRVVATASLVWHAGPYAYTEYSAQSFPSHEIATAVAFVRDDEVWSVLKPVSGAAIEPVALFSFHFPEGVDNSGFVGWLATLLKRELGTGLFVVCGCNSHRGGIFDYWGVPWKLREATASALDHLRTAHRSSGE